MNIGEVLARDVMGKDFIDTERPAYNWSTTHPDKRPKAKKVMHGFDPRKMVSTVSFTCTACRQHCSRDDEQCPHCHAEFVDTIWNPPADIKEALEKQKPMAVVNTGEGPSPYRCPHCSAGLLMYIPHCAYCGQHLDWRDVK